MVNLVGKQCVVRTLHKGELCGEIISHGFNRSGKYYNVDMGHILGIDSFLEKDVCILNPPDVQDNIDFSSLRAANITRNEEWCAVETGTTKPSILFRTVELAGEVGELCNIIKKIEREKMGVVGSEITTFQELIDEIADVVISLDLLAMDLRIDLPKVIKEKFNKTSIKYDLKTTL